MGSCCEYDAEYGFGRRVVWVTPAAMVFFPQLEVNVDAYPTLPGIHIHFVTNEKGKGAQDKARALVSGFQVMFVRR
jgi:large subunit ribosomal protein L5